jgi:hypothetical protein
LIATLIVAPAALASRFANWIAADKPRRSGAINQSWARRPQTLTQQARE